MPKITLVSPAKFLNPTPGKNFHRAFSEYQKGNQGKARTEFQKIIRKAPNHFPSYLGIGYTYLAEENIDFAERYIRKTIELAPGYAQAHFALATVFEMRQDYDNALTELDEVMRIIPDYPSIQESRKLMKLKTTEKHLTLGHNLVNSNPDEALQHLRIVLELAPEIPQAPLEIGEILLRQDKCEEAVPYLQIADEKLPANAEVKNNLARCLVELQEYDHALHVYEEIAKLQPDDLPIKQRIEEVKRAIFVRSLPEDYHRIPRTEYISRCQLAALLIVNLKFLEKYSSQDSQIIVDTLDHWAQSFIQKTVNLGILDLLPNRTFEPGQPITKLELAKASWRLLEILEMEKNQSFTNPGNILISIPDVPSSNIYYSMISKALSAEVISLDADGRFHASRAVSGAEALSMVNRLRNLAE